MKKVTVYSLSTCPACKRAKEFLTKNNVEFKEVVVDMLVGGEQWVAIKTVKGYNPAETFPTIVIEDVVVGADTEALKKALEL